MSTHTDRQTDGRTGVRTFGKKEHPVLNAYVDNWAAQVLST